MPHPWTKEGQQPGRLKGRIELRGEGQEGGVLGLLDEGNLAKIGKIARLRGNCS